MLLNIYGLEISSRQFFGWVLRLWQARSEGGGAVTKEKFVFNLCEETISKTDEGQPRPK